MKNKIDINKWKEFKIGDLFDIHPTKAYKILLLLIHVITMGQGDILIMIALKMEI